MIGLDRYVELLVPFTMHRYAQEAEAPFKESDM
jgi:hypothetical protein